MTMSTLTAGNDSSVVADVGGSGMRIATVRDGAVSDIRRVAVDSYPQLVGHIQSACRTPKTTNQNQPTGD